MPDTSPTTPSTAATVVPARHGMSNTEKWIYRFLHIAVLVLSIYLIISIALDTLHGHGIQYYDKPEFLKTQLFICCVFLIDFIVEFFMAHDKGRYLLTHSIFFIVSIPYLWLLDKFGIKVQSPQVAYLLQFVPLARGGYALAIVVGWLTSNKAASLFITYLITLIATVFFSSLVFYMFERNVNPLVTDFTDALWWASMDVTTVGSNIVAVTPEGRVLSVLLAALGMMMFPIFTVYITSLITKNHQQAQSGNTTLN